ncbi:MAG: hypothetical protein PHC95_15415 [Parabacteroides sp.]|nr:hypothetical protein [Parabacteroides sp.]
MADTRLLVGLCLSLLISSLAISIVTGAGAASLGDIGGAVNQSINFESDTYGWKNYISTLEGEWKVTDGALTSQSSGINRFYLEPTGKPDGLHTTTYHIESGGRPYAIIIRDTGWFADSIQLRVMPTGVYLESYEGLWYRPFQKYYPAIIPQNTIVTVTLDDASSRVTVTVNGQEIIHNEEVTPDGSLSWGTVYYAGITAEGPGFRVTKIASDAEAYDEQSFDMLGFISAVSGVLVWYTSSGVALVDAFINLIIKIQQLGIAVVIITIIRGN